MKPRSVITSLPAAAALMIGSLICGTGSGYAAWQLAWSDEFNGTNVDATKWAFETGNGSSGWGNWEREYYTSRTNNAYTTDGALHIVARKESYGGFPYTSARMKTQGLFSKRYGRFEFRAKLPQGLGFWPALWMMGTNITSAGWPACGEVDVMENKGSSSNQVGGALHYSDSKNNHLQQDRTYIVATSVTNFHTYAVEWTTNSIKWVVDGTTVQTWSSWSSSTGPYPAPFNQPFFIIMNLAIGGGYLGYPSDADIDANTVFPGEMQVDYVRVYDYVTEPPNAPTGLAVTPGNAIAYLSWDASTSGATGYNVKRATSSGGPYTTVATPATNSYTDVGVSSCASYYYVVSATNSVGESANSAEKIVALPAYQFAVNSGGSAAVQFLAETNFVGGTQAAPVTAAIDTSGVVAPAPQAVYQTERYGNFTYTFTGLTPGVNYTVRLHFAETYWTAVGQRRFNVSINGTQVLTNFDIVAIAGAPNKATIQEFTAAASGSGQMVIQYVTVTDNARSSGLEILLPRTATPTGLTATPGNSQVALNWTPLAGASYNLKCSLVSGGPYTPVSGALTTTNYTDSGLTNGITCYYVVSAVNAGCESTNSAQVSTTPACTPPPVPTVGNNGPIWAGMTLNLIASMVPGATYSWTGPNGFASTNQYPSIVNASSDASGLFSLTATVDGCSSAPATTTVTVHPPATVTIQSLPGSVILSWPGGTLQSATNVTGPWGNVGGAASPYTNAPDAPQEFYRLLLQ